MRAEMAMRLRVMTLLFLLTGSIEIIWNEVTSYPNFNRLVASHLGAFDLMELSDAYIGNQCCKKDRNNISHINRLIE